MDRSNGFFFRFECVIMLGGRRFLLKRFCDEYNKT